MAVEVAGLLAWLLAAPRHLGPGARLVVAADVAWVVGALLLLSVVPPALSPLGPAVLALVTAAVATIAATEIVSGQGRGMVRVRTDHRVGWRPSSAPRREPTATPA